MTCTCGMYRTRGICYHTGYRPTFTDRTEPEPVFIPEAVKRSQQYVKEHKAQWDKENDTKERQERERRAR